MGDRLYIMQPWFAGIGHPALSLLYTYSALVAHADTQCVVYLPQRASTRTQLEDVAIRCRAINVAGGLQIAGQSALLQAGTLATVRWLARQRDASSSTVFFMDASPHVLELGLRIFRPTVKRLVIMLLAGPDGYQNGSAHRVKWRLTTFLLRRDNVHLLVRTPHLRNEWATGVPSLADKVDYLDSLECAGRPAPIRISRRGGGERPEFLICGQIRPGKCVEPLVEAFSRSPRLGRLTIVGEFTCESLYRRAVASGPSVRVKRGFLSEGDLASFVTLADYSVLLYHPWNPSMESAVLYQSAYYQCPVVCFDDGWLGETVRAHQLGWTFARSQRHALGDCLATLPPPGSDLYEQVTENMMQFVSRMRSPERVSSAVEKLLGISTSQADRCVHV